MDRNEFTDEMPGSWARNVAGEYTFLPNPLPREPRWLNDLVALVADASTEVGRLQGALQQEDGLNPALMLRPLVQREATLSSRIEGTVAAEEDLALFEVENDVEERTPDVRELSNYLHALEWGTREAITTGITAGFVRRLHQILMEGVRGGDQTPGRFRERQVLIGGDGSYARAKFIPPPCVHVGALIDDLVDFSEKASRYPALVRAALAHYQFETIHPFHDGNGRVGRLLITIQVVRDLQMTLPALHMSAYFEADRRAYYDGLLNLSRTGNWAAWTEYFLRGVISQARQTTLRLGELRALRKAYRAKFEKARGSMLTGKSIDLLFGQPAITIRALARHLGVTPAAAQLHVRRLVDAGVVMEVTGREYGRVYLAKEIIQTAREGGRS